MLIDTNRCPLSRTKSATAEFCPPPYARLAPSPLVGGPYVGYPDYMALPGKSSITVKDFEFRFFSGSLLSLLGCPPGAYSTEFMTMLPTPSAMPRSRWFQL